MGSTGRKNTGRIFIRANKYYLRYRINDKEKTVSLGIKTDQADAKNKAKKEAAKYLPILEAQTRKEVAAHVAIAKRLEKERQHLPLSDAWKIFEASPFRPHCSTKTLAGHKQKFTHFINWLGQNIPLIDRIDKIDSSITANYAASLTKISGRNYNAYIGSLKLIFKTLLQQRKIETNPFDCIVKRPLETVSKADFDDEQMEAILTTFEDSKLHLMHKTETETLYYLGTYTGLRLNDCVLSEWKDYNLKTKLITCIPYKTRKSNRSVIIPMHPTLLKKLKELKKENNLRVPSS
ncbi:MAG: phage integrase family protein [Lentisphaerae bacterium]|nr:phage integrase family protein [Lentisphaerota bacterium]